MKNANRTSYFSVKNHSISLAALLGILVFTPAAPLRGDDNRQSPQAAEPAKPKVKPYPLKGCIVSDEELGSMGKPVIFVYKGQEIKLCCKGCRKDFDKDPEKYLKKLAPKK